MSKTRSEVESEAREAWRNGASYVDNPYRPSSEEWVWWNRTWTDCNRSNLTRG